MRANRGLRPLAQLPVVARSKARQHGTFYDLLQRYQRLPKEPLVVSAEIISPTILSIDQAIHLDALLTYAVTEDFPCATVHEEGSATRVIPLPIELVWVSERGLPLWAASDLTTETEWLREPRYIHKRYPSDRVEWCRSPNALTTAGRYKEARIPLPTRVPGEANAITAALIGNRDEVARLLNDYVSHVGKKTAHGLGRVASWVVKPWHVDGEIALARILDGRYVPVDYYIERGTLAAQVSDFERRLLPNRGWTPPYWFAPFASTVVAPVRR